MLIPLLTLLGAGSLLLESTFDGTGVGSTTAVVAMMVDCVLLGVAND